MKIMFALLSLMFISPHLKIQKDWITELNNHPSEDLVKYYDDNCGILLNGKLHTGPQNIETSLAHWKRDLSGLESYLEANKTSSGAGHIMSLGYLQKNGQEYTTLIAWRKTTNGLKKEFETLEKCTGKIAPEDLVEIDRQRDNWVKYSNEHRPDLVISEVYSSDAYYYNQGRVDKGTEAITERYSYMLQPGWKIKLEKKGILAVNQHTAFEIGYYHSGGTGQYLLIWKKYKEGWKVFLDFNF